MYSIMESGKKFGALRQPGKNAKAHDTLYSPAIVSIEAGSPLGQSRRSEGLAAIKGKSEWWATNHEVHKTECSGPWPHDDRFILRFTYEITPKVGPMAGKRFARDEAALFTVKDGKIVKEEYFCSM
jgi:hypothetical protein